MVLAWEYLQEVFVTLVFISFLILFFILFPGYFTMPEALHPSFSGPWRPPPALSSTPTTFDCFFLFHLPQALRFWVGIFLFTGVFYLKLLPNIFGTTCFYQGLPGSLQFYLEVYRLHTDPRSTAHLFVWFTVIRNPLYILNLYLYMSILQKVLLVVKTLIKNIIFLVLNNHENIKQ